jgi:hypothetical protein
MHPKSKKIMMEVVKDIFLRSEGHSFYFVIVLRLYIFAQKVKKIKVG